MNNMRGGPERGGKALIEGVKGMVLVSGDGVKRMVLDRIGDHDVRIEKRRPQ